MPSTSRTGTRFPHGARIVTVTRLYRLLVVSSLLGVALPVLTVVLGLAANDFAVWKELRGHEGRLSRLVDEHPFLDIEEHLPVLAQLSWHDRSRASKPHNVRWAYYRGYAISNLWGLLVLVVFRRAIRRWLEDLTRWFYEAEHRGARRIIFGWGALTILSFQLKLLPGFYYPGVHGWHHDDVRSNLSTVRPRVTEHAIRIAGQSPFLAGALAPENASYLPGPGYLTHTAMFLHFADGQALPTNFDLANLVFPSYAFGSADSIREPMFLVDVVKASLDRRRQRRSFILPLSIAYPNHFPFHEISYDSYPPARDLREISFWRLVVHVDENRSVEPIAAIPTTRISVAHHGTAWELRQAISKRGHGWDGAEGNAIIEACGSAPPGELHAELLFDVLVEPVDDALAIATRLYGPYVLMHAWQYAIPDNDDLAGPYVTVVFATGERKRVDIDLERFLESRDPDDLVTVHLFSGRAEEGIDDVLCGVDAYIDRSHYRQPKRASWSLMRDEVPFVGPSELELPTGPPDRR